MSAALGAAARGPGPRMSRARSSAGGADGADEVVAPPHAAAMTATLAKMPKRRLLHGFSSERVTYPMTPATATRPRLRGRSSCMPSGRASRSKRSDGRAAATARIGSVRCRYYPQRSRGLSTDAPNERSYGGSGNGPGHERAPADCPAGSGHEGVRLGLSDARGVHAVTLHLERPGCCSAASGRRLRRNRPRPRRRRRPCRRRRPRRSADPGRREPSVSVRVPRTVVTPPARRPGDILDLDRHARGRHPSRASGRT